MKKWLLAALITGIPFLGLEAAAADSAPTGRDIDMRWGVKIPLRDGVRLNATLYTPHGRAATGPCIITMTPYISQSYHDRGTYFAGHGFTFLTIDVRGRGNSEGTFRPLIQEAHDGYDVVEWLATQPYCGGKVAMWGGSYAGYDQWATAKERPPHLATIVPVASPYATVDFPMNHGIFYPYLIQWLTFTSGHASQERLFGDSSYWAARFQELFESGAPFSAVDGLLGSPPPIFREWISHPDADAYWDTYNPTAEQYASLTLPILTITGSHDGDQPGALQHYREYMKSATPEGRARHFLIIGPWDHAGTRTPRAEFGGLKFGPASLVDLPGLHREWYAWTMQGGPRPTFLKKPVAYYVMFADRWRYADTLEAVTGEMRPYYLDSRGSAGDVLASGSLGATPGRGAPDGYVFDPRDVSLAALEAGVDAESLVDQTMVYARAGRHLVYHTAPFEHDTEVSGFFRLKAWIAIDQPDTDFSVQVDEVRADGSSLPLAAQLMRARYRHGQRQPALVDTRAPLEYDFNQFTFVSQQVKKGSRLRLVIGPTHSIYLQKAYNAPGDVSTQTAKDARTVNVRLLHDREHPSALYVPIGAPGE
ncbi:MAG: CocE/NonD family hydrolase [Proteobacteria bacterium]|nr:CocE/NonD family hydrolase [Pseudomonadota bacterium]